VTDVLQRLKHARAVVVSSVTFCRTALDGPLRQVSTSSAAEVLEAAECASRRQSKLNELDEPQWLFRGRLLQVLGFPEQGREGYAKVTDDSQLTDLTKRYQTP
jgi:hypothetical protein